MSRFSVQVEAEERVPRREIERVEKDVNLFLAVYQRADEATMREGLARRDGRRVQGIR